MKYIVMKRLCHIVVVFLLILSMSGCKENDPQPCDSIVTASSAESSTVSNPRLREAMRDYLQIVEEGADDLQLTVYYLDPVYELRAPYTTTAKLLSDPYVTVIEIDNIRLKENLGLLRRINPDNLNEAYPSTRMDCRLCYIFSSKGKGTILEIAFRAENKSGDYHNAFVNGIEVEYADVFCEVIQPLISEEDMILIECIYKNIHYDSFRK